MSGLTLNQLAEKNAEYVTKIEEIEKERDALKYRLQMINALTLTMEQANNLAKEAFAEIVKERDALAAEASMMRRQLDEFFEL